MTFKIIIYVFFIQCYCNYYSIFSKENLDKSDWTDVSVSCSVSEISKIFFSLTFFHSKMSFSSHYPPIVSSKNHLKCRNHNNRIKTSSIKRKKTSNSNRPFLERRYVETTSDLEIRARFSENGHASPYYPKPMRVNARIVRRQQPPGRTRRKAPMYDRRVVEGALSASNVEYLDESYPNFRTEPDREMSPSVADQKIGSIFIHSAPPSMHPMDVQSARDVERFPESQKIHRDRRVTVEDTASKSTLHTEEAHGLLTPVPTTKNIEHLECYLHHQCKIPRRRCGSAVYRLSNPIEKDVPLWTCLRLRSISKRIPQRSLHHQLCELDKVLLLE